MSKNTNNKKNDNKIKENNIINDFSKKNFFEYIFSKQSIFNYKIVLYWLPLLLFIIITCLIIFITQTESEFVAGLISGLVIFIIYFIVDFTYQVILCKNTNKFKLVKNSLINSITPCIFVMIGYIIAYILPNVKNCNIHFQNTGIEERGELRKRDTDITRLINIHKNNLTISIFFYIFSIIYNNPLNKKKCSNNNLC
tara:strand:+ start:196 stop:786 length:591 start_codon:yes stop_codon:yes gene_type:complete